MARKKAAEKKPVEKAPVEETAVEETAVEETAVEETAVEETAGTEEAGATEEAPAERTKEEEDAYQDLLDTAADLNKVFALEPLINLELPEAEVVELVTTAAGEALAADEKDLEPETWAFLKENGMLAHLDKPAEEPKKTTGSAKKGGFTKRADTDARNTLVKKLIGEGKHTAPQITEAVLEKFPEHKKSSVQTLVSDSKNEKYTKFDKVAVMDAETKILSFPK